MLHVTSKIINIAIFTSLELKVGYFNTCAQSLHSVILNEISLKS